MLSTKLGYFRPARLAAAFAFALVFGVNFVCRLFFGAGFFHGAFFVGINSCSSAAPKRLRPFADARSREPLPAWDRARRSPSSPKALTLGDVPPRSTDANRARHLRSRSAFVAAERRPDELRRKKREQCSGDERLHLPAGWLVRSTLRRREEAPRQGPEGAPDAWLEIEPQFAEALLGTESATS